jgi:hypothetical protein
VFVHYWTSEICRMSYATHIIKAVDTAPWNKQRKETKARKVTSSDMHDNIFCFPKNAKIRTCVSVAYNRV